MSRRIDGHIASGYTTSTSLPDAVDAELLAALNSNLTSVGLPQISNILDATPNLLIALYEALYKKRLPFIDRTSRSHTSFNCRVKNTKILIGTIAHEGAIGQDSALELGEIDPRKVCEKDLGAVRELLWVLVKIAQSRASNKIVTVESNPKKTINYRQPWSVDRTGSGGLVKEDQLVSGTGSSGSILTGLHQSLQKRKELAGKQTVLPRLGQPNRKALDWIQGLPSSFSNTEIVPNSDVDVGDSTHRSLDSLSDSSCSSSTSEAPVRKIETLPPFGKQQSVMNRLSPKSLPAAHHSKQKTPHGSKPVKPKSYPHASYNISPPRFPIPDDQISPVSTVYLEQVSARILEISSRLLPKPSFLADPDNSNIVISKNVTCKVNDSASQNQSIRHETAVNTSKTSPIPAAPKTRTPASKDKIKSSMNQIHTSPRQHSDKVANSRRPEPAAPPLPPSPLNAPIPIPTHVQNHTMEKSIDNSINLTPECHRDAPENVTTLSYQREEQLEGKRRTVSFYISEVDEPATRKPQQKKLPNQAAPITPPHNEGIDRSKKTHYQTPCTTTSSEKSLTKSGPKTPEPVVQQADPSPRAKLIEHSLGENLVDLGDDRNKEGQISNPNRIVDLLSDTIPINEGCLAYKPISPVRGVSGLEMAVESPVDKPNESSPNASVEGLLISIHDEVSPPMESLEPSHNPSMTSTNYQSIPEAASQDVSNFKQNEAVSTAFAELSILEEISFANEEHTDDIAPQHPHDPTPLSPEHSRFSGGGSPPWAFDSPSFSKLPTFAHDEGSGGPDGRVFSSTPRPVNGKWISLSAESSPGAVGSHHAPYSTYPQDEEYPIEEADDSRIEELDTDSSNEEIESEVSEDGKPNRHVSSIEESPLAQRSLRNSMSHSSRSLPRIDLESSFSSNPRIRAASAPPMTPPRVFQAQEELTDEVPQQDADNSAGAWSDVDSEAGEEEHQGDYEEDEEGDEMDGEYEEEEYDEEAGEYHDEREAHGEAREEKQEEDHEEDHEQDHGEAHEEVEGENHTQNHQAERAEELDSEAEPEAEAAASLPKKQIKAHLIGLDSEAEDDDTGFHSSQYEEYSTLSHDDESGPVPQCPSPSPSPSRSIHSTPPKRPFNPNISSPTQSSTSPSLSRSRISLKGHRSSSSPNILLSTTSRHSSSSHDPLPPPTTPPRQSSSASRKSDMPLQQLPAPATPFTPIRPRRLFSSPPHERSKSGLLEGFTPPSPPPKPAVSLVNSSSPQPPLPQSQPLKQAAKPSLIPSPIPKSTPREQQPPLPPQSTTPLTHPPPPHPPLHPQLSFHAANTSGSILGSARKRREVSLSSSSPFLTRRSVSKAVSSPELLTASLSSSIGTGKGKGKEREREMDGEIGTSTLKGKGKEKEKGKEKVKGLAREKKQPRRGDGRSQNQAHVVDSGEVLPEWIDI